MLKALDKSTNQLNEEKKEKFYLAQRNAGRLAAAGIILSGHGLSGEPPGGNEPSLQPVRSMEVPLLPVPCSAFWI